VANQFFITKVVVDIVYGTLADAGANCAERVFTQKTSIQFFENENSKL
jgi:hypothetical protein